jgi:methionyl-tRNA formyltransferase
LLPAYRGAAPVQWAVLQGEKVTGVSVIHMTPRLDGGPILASASIPIGADETAGQLEHRLAQGFFAGIDGHNLVAGEDETAAHHAEDLGVIVNDQKLLAHITLYAYR